MEFLNTILPPILKYRTTILIIIVLAIFSLFGYEFVSQFGKVTDESSAESMAPIRVTIPEGLRKEQIASIFGKELKWSNNQVKIFITESTAVTWNKVEGYYPPGTYMVPPDASPWYVADLMRDAAEEIYAPFKSKITDEQWQEVLKVASIVQRDGSTAEEMENISKRIWMRLDIGEPLKSDATVQYAKDTINNYGESGCKPGEKPVCASWKFKYEGKQAAKQGWWNPITDEDRYGIDWEFNTYLYTGLPERPISNPSLTAIKAAISTRYTPEGEPL